MHECCIQGSRLAAASRAGDQQDAVGQGEDLQHAAFQLRAEAQRCKITGNIIPVQQSQHHALAIHCRHGRYTQVDFLATYKHFEAPVLCQTALGDIQVSHDLDA